ncbi:restin homolog [Ctenocephalides felis]|uniref:restin homolog n=1 Tax=Ctenocephalides felis TaxID=7515 RepID=UPI000E6E20BE|nr:restin homolog [Ctenocephalides felis]
MDGAVVTLSKEMNQPLKKWTRKIGNATLYKEDEKKIVSSDTSSGQASSGGGWEADNEDASGKRRKKVRALYTGYKINNIQTGESDIPNIADESEPDFMAVLDQLSDTSFSSRNVFLTAFKSDTISRSTEIAEKRLLVLDDILRDLELYFLRSLASLKFDGVRKLRLTIGNYNHIEKTILKFRKYMRLQESCIKNMNDQSSQKVDSEHNTLADSLKLLQSSIKNVSNYYLTFRTYQRALFNGRIILHLFDLDELQSNDRMKLFENQMHHMSKAFDRILNSYRSCTFRCTSICDQVFNDCDLFSNQIHNNMKQCNEKMSNWQDCLKEIENRNEKLKFDNFSLQSRIHDLEEILETKEKHFHDQEQTWLRRINEMSSAIMSALQENEELRKSADVSKKNIEELNANINIKENNVDLKDHCKSLKKKLKDLNKENADITATIKEYKEMVDTIKSEKYSLMSDKDILEKKIELLESQIKQFESSGTNRLNINGIYFRSNIFAKITNRISKKQSACGIRKKMNICSTDKLSFHKAKITMSNAKTSKISKYCSNESQERISTKSCVSVSNKHEPFSKVFREETDSKLIFQHYANKHFENCKSEFMLQNTIRDDKNYQTSFNNEILIKQSVACYTDGTLKQVESDQNTKKKLRLGRSNSDLSHTFANAFVMFENNSDRNMPADKPKLAVLSNSKDNISFTCKHVNCKSLFYKLQEAEKKLEEKNRSCNKLKSLITSLKRKYQSENQRYVSLQQRYEKILQEKALLSYQCKSQCEEYDSECAIKYIDFDGFIEMKNFKDDIIEELKNEIKTLDDEFQHLLSNYEQVNGTISNYNIQIRASTDSIAKTQTDNIRLQNELFQAERELSRISGLLKVKIRENDELQKHYEEIVWLAKDHEINCIESDSQIFASDYYNVDLRSLILNNSILCKKLLMMLDESKNIDDINSYQNCLDKRSAQHLSEQTDETISEQLLEVDEVQGQDQINNIVDCVHTNRDYFVPAMQINELNGVLVKFNAGISELKSYMGSRMHKHSEGYKKMLLYFIMFCMNHFTLKSKNAELVDKVKKMESLYKAPKINISKDIEACKNDLKEQITTLTLEIRKIGHRSNGIYHNANVNSTNSKLQREINQLTETNNKLRDENEKLQNDMKKWITEIAEVKSLVDQKEDDISKAKCELKVLRDELVDCQKLLQQTHDRDLEEQNRKLEDAKSSETELEDKLLAATDNYNRLIDDYKALKTQIDEKSLLEITLLQEISQLRHNNEELRKPRFNGGSCKNCENERSAFEDKLRKLSCEAEGASNLVVEIRRSSKEELVQTKNQHAEEMRRLQLENDALCECNKALRSQLGRLEADNMLLAKSIETRNRKSRPRDLKNDSGQNSNDGIRKSKICRKNN